MVDTTLKSHLKIIKQIFILLLAIDENFHICHRNSGYTLCNGGVDINFGPKFQWPNFFVFIIIYCQYIDDKLIFLNFSSIYRLGQ